MRLFFVFISFNSNKLFCLTRCVWKGDFARCT